MTRSNKFAQIKLRVAKDFGSMDKTIVKSVTQIVFHAVAHRLIAIAAWKDINRLLDKDALLRYSLLQ